MKNCRSSNPFTLVEMLVAMGLFSLLMLVLMSFFDSSQKLVSLSVNKIEVYENARTAFDLMTRDIQCAYYEPNRGTTFKGIPFYVDQNTTNDTMRIAMVSASDSKPNSVCHSNLFEVEYCNASYKLFRSIIGDKTNSGVNTNWDFYGKDQDAFATGQDFNELIPYVINMTITRFTEAGTMDAGVNGFPSSVKIDLTLMAKNDFKIWEQRGFDATFKNEKVTTFTKTVFIGSRGQQ